MASYKKASDLIEELRNLPKHLRLTNIRFEDVDSRAEFNVYWSLQKISACEIIPQYQVEPYRVDFLLRRPNGMIAIEIDGKEWHSSERDSKRDKYILENSDISDIVRFTGTDASFTPSFCVNFLFENYRFLFVDSHREGWHKRATHFLKHKLRFEGVIDHELCNTQNNNEYKVYCYDLEFVMPEDHKEYFIHNDGQPDHLRKPITDYTKNRDTEIKVMDNG